MANKMPPELLEKFKKKNGEGSEESTEDKAKRAKTKARKAKEMCKKD